jgi:truncated hemoglobin YjbI
MTLFDKYGGTPTVTSVVRSFYKDVLQNPRLKPYFSGVATEKLIHHQIIFISQLLGKPVSEKLNSDLAMRDAHAGQRVSESAFLEVTAILKNVLVVHQMEEADIAGVMSLIEGLKTAIVELPTVTRTGRPAA